MAGLVFKTIDGVVQEQTLVDKDRARPVVQLIVDGDYVNDVEVDGAILF